MPETQSVDDIWKSIVPECVCKISNADFGIHEPADEGTCGVLIASNVETKSAQRWSGNSLKAKLAKLFFVAWMRSNLNSPS